MIVSEELRHIVAVPYSSIRQSHNVGCAVWFQ